MLNKVSNALVYKVGLQSEGYNVVVESYDRTKQFYYCSLRHQRNGNWFQLKVKGDEGQVYKNGRLHQVL